MYRNLYVKVGVDLICVLKNLPSCQLEVDWGQGGGRLVDGGFISKAASVEFLLKGVLGI